MTEEELNALTEIDAELSPEQLDDKYNPDGDGEHPRYVRGDWIEAVFRQYTLLGYWDWVSYQLNEEQNPS